MNYERFIAANGIALITHTLVSNIFRKKFKYKIKDTTY
jgi:hypothetical protein